MLGHAMLGHAILGHAMLGYVSNEISDEVARLTCALEPLSLDHSRFITRVSQPKLTRGLPSRGSNEHSVATQF